MEQDNQFLKWATDLQSIAQAGLEYGKDIFDKERYEKVREIAGEMMQAQTGLPKEKIDTLFLGMKDIRRLRLIRVLQFLKMTRFCS